MAKGKTSKSKQQKPKKRAYSDETRERALAMMLGGVPYSRITRELGVPKATLSSWKQAMGSDEFAEQRADRRARLIEAIWDAATEVVMEIQRKVKEEEDLHKVVGAFAQLAAKGALLADGQPGQPGVNVNIQNQSGGVKNEYDITQRIEQYRDVFESLAQQSDSCSRLGSHGAGEPLDTS